MNSCRTTFASVLVVLAASSSAPAAGLVLVEVSSGYLFITGDYSANQISISDDDSDGFWDIVGSGGTTINGHPSVTTSEAFDNVRINLKEGDDSVKLADAEIAGVLQIWQGDGSDKATVMRTTIGRSIEVDGDDLGGDEDGDDSVTFKDVTAVEPGFYSSLAMQGSPGRDKVKIKGFRGWGMTIGFDGGDDRCNISDLEFPIAGYSYLSISTGGGRDQISLNSVTSQSIYANLNEGDADRLKISRSDSSTNTLDGGSGLEDRLQLDDESALGTGTPVNFEK